MKKIFSILALLLMAVTGAWAETPNFLYQGSWYQDLDDAVDDACDNGGTIYLRAGTWGSSSTERKITISDGVAITFQPYDEGDEVIFDGQNNDYWLFQIKDENAHITFKDITFRNGGAFEGGAIEVIHGQVTLNNCKFIGNKASQDGAGNFGFGGAIFLDESDASIVANNCEFINNQAASGGGAVYVEDGATATFKNCYFKDNKADGSENHVQDESGSSSSYSFENCLFKGKGEIEFDLDNENKSIEITPEIEDGDANLVVLYKDGSYYDGKPGITGFTVTFSDLETGTYTIYMMKGTEKRYEYQNVTFTVTENSLNPTYSVTLAEGTEDAENWTIASGTNSVKGNVAEGLTGLSEGDALTLTYSGQKRVKSVKAVVEEADGEEATDLSMVDCAGNARAEGKAWTANCYMVHTAGDYKLPLVYGNAIKDGALNDAAYTGVENNDDATATFPNHAGDAINAPWITKAASGTGVNKGMGITVASAELLWQDAEGLITKVGIDGDYLTLTVGNNATEQEGNAVIAAKLEDGTIVWSWHIWVTKETFATLTTIATGSHDYKVTPVNLGWVTTGGDGKQGYNTFYQWGRKDAFKGTGAPAEANVYDIENGTTTGFTYTASTEATIADNIKNPTTYYCNSGSFGPCTTTYYNMWDAQNTATDNVTTATKKTVYDPCPPGFCVPTGNLYSYANDQGVSSTEWDSTNKGRTWQGIFFPASGYRNNANGNVGSGGGYCWSASPGGSVYGRRLNFYSGWCWDNSRRADGFPVRAVAEE